MPTLLERSSDLRAMVGRLNAATGERDRFGRLTVRSQQVCGARDQLNKAQAAARLLKGRGLPLGNEPRPSTKLRGKAPVLRAVLAVDWREFADDQTVNNTFIEPVKAHADKLNEAALTVWRAHADAGLPPIREPVIASLSVAGFGSQCARLRELRNEVDKLKRANPSSSADFERLGALKMELQNLWGELDGVPADVRSFLAKAAQRTATFDDLTSGIRAWLSDRAMLGQLRIGLG